MAAVTVRSDFGAQEKEISHYFHLFPFYLPCSNGAGCHDLSFLIFSFKLAGKNPIEYPPEMVSLKIDWFGLLAVQGTLRSLL